MKKRIIPIQLLNGKRLVKSKVFAEFRDVGDPTKSAAVYNSQTADELILLNVNRAERSVTETLAALQGMSKVCFMPLCVGGGVETFEDAHALISAGADKISINSAAYRDPALVQKISSHFGSQAVVVSIDVSRDRDGQAALFSDCGRQREDIGLAAHMKRCMELGAGEFLVQAIHRDGCMDGFDLPLVADICSFSRVPVIAAGGGGDYSHLADAFAAGDLAAVACGSLFNFSDSNPIRARSFLRNHGLAFRNV